MRRTMAVTLLALLALLGCVPLAPPVAPPPYVPEYRCDGQWARVRGPDGAWSQVHEGFDCPTLTPGAWACCAPAGGTLGCHRPAECDGAPDPTAAWTQPGGVPAAATVVAFSDAMATGTHAHLFAKTDAPEMRLAASLLHALHIQDVDQFMDGSATTLPFPGPGGAVASIYLPFVRGVPRGAWDTDAQMGAFVHEPEHVLEYARDGVATVAYRYIISPHWLVDYEVEAYLGQRAYLGWRGARGYDLAAWGDLLAQYGVGAPWVVYARAMMSVGAVAIDRDADAPQAWREFAHPWLDAHAPELRRVPLLVAPPSN